MDGLFTQAGWAYAEAGGAAAAIERTVAESERVLGRAVAPPSVEALLEKLQRRTLAAWSQYLGDLRVRPFTDQPDSVMISGTLARGDSPLDALLREVWKQAGGQDRGRSNQNQLRIAAEFGPMIQFVERGRMKEISQIFAALNVGLATLGEVADVGRRRIMDAQARAASVTALQQAPRLVVQIVEDVLAQTAASQAALGKPYAAMVWERDVAPLCRAALGGLYPFAPGPDAKLSTVEELLGPQGRIASFFGEHLAGLMDTGESPWRWKPEARMSGFVPESAAFFERAAAVANALFPPEHPVELTLAALAQRGAATVSLGGASVPVVTSGEMEALRWPGPEPDRGFGIAFATDGPGEQKEWSGPWGLLRFLDELRVRARDGGRRYLLDVRLQRTRAYLELSFASALNPVSAQAGLRGLTCPASL
jgi:type VI protein secretion system component VasK